MEDVSTAGIVLLKLGFGAVLGGAIGWERELSGRPAGTRTHMLVVVGVILFSETSRLFPSQDPSRIAAQIVTGIGFLGAGTILRMGTQIRGLTTAASIWAAAAIGMAVSVGGALLIVAPVATILTILTLTVVERVEERFARKGVRKLQITLAALASTPQVTDAILRMAPDLRNVSFSRIGNHVVATFRVSDAPEDLPLRLAELESLESARWVD
ncbi:MAG: MgtC/SapB family protein [Armatimonadota bacterium]